VRVYTVQLASQRPPALVPEGFSWGALVFGGLWLLAHRAWIPGVLALCAAVALGLFLGGWAVLVLAWALGVFGNDFRRWALSLGGYQLAHVVAATDADGALTRLLAVRPDLIGAMAAR
jgi:hypothetical protein